MLYNLNCDEDLLFYFNGMICKYNLNKDHFIIKVNCVLSDLSDDNERTFIYIESMYDDICYYYKRKPVEAEIIMTLIDRMLNLLPHPKLEVENTLENLCGSVPYDPTKSDLDSIASKINNVVSYTKRLIVLKKNLRNLLDKIFEETGADYRSNDYYDPWIDRETCKSVFN